jgi:ribosomal protein S30
MPTTIEPTRSSSSKRGGQGSHGSLTKAGKMRHQQPLNWSNARKTKKLLKGKGREAGKVIGTSEVMNWHKKKHDNPRLSKRRNAHRRLSEEDGGLGREVGQWKGPISRGDQLKAGRRK